ncbi:MAG: hypothetical protein AB7O66_07575 [Limisphaerales bacterium]
MTTTAEGNGAEVSASPNRRRPPQQADLVLHGEGVPPPRIRPRRDEAERYRVAGGWATVVPEYPLARTHAAKIALDRVVELIREAPDAPPSREFRRFLWSLFNGHHPINLWRLRHTLDRQQSEWATEVFTASMNGHVSEELLRRALTDSGEFNPETPKRSTQMS